MNKKLLSNMLLIILIGGFALAGTKHFTARAATNIIGIITSDTTWTKANSPYNLTGNVLIDSGVTVTVETDTVVNLYDYYIRVNGTMFIQPGVTINMESMDAGIQVNGLLNAKGTSENPIHINGAVGYIVWIAPPSYSVISFSAYSTGWNEQTGSGSIIENAIIDSTTIETSNSLRIRNNIINSGAIYVLDGSPVISGNAISSRINIKGGSCIISNNNIKNGFILFYGEKGTDSATITNNVISHAQSVSGISAGIWFSGSSMGGGHVLIEKNLIANNYEGIRIFSPNYDDLKTSLAIQANSITNNEVGISIQNRYSPTKITNNNINNNSTNIQLAEKASIDIDATYNWWGTTDTQTISQSFIDFEDDFNLGTITFVPFLTESNPQAMPDLNAPVPTPTPGQTHTTSPSPTPTPTHAPQQTESTTIAGAVIVTIVIGVGIGFLIYLIKRK